MKRKRLLAAGGDRRQLAAAASLAASAEEFAVYLTDYEPADAVPEGIALLPPEACGGIHPDVLLLPMPASADGVHVCAPNGTGQLRIDALTALLPQGAPVLGGRMDAALCAALRDAGLRPADYAKQEAFAVRNAVPTAEGALELALRELPVTLHGLPALLLGAGRLSRALQPRLRALGAAVTVAARRCSDLARSKGGRRKPAEYKKSRPKSRTGFRFRRNAI